MLSIVIPVLDEAGTLATLHAELSEVAAAEGYQLDIVLVDDGSTDCSWETIRRLAAADPCVTGVRFRRNFGKAAALSAGFAQSRGERIMTLDGDLQDDPREIPRFLAEMEKSLDVVSGWKKTRHDPWHKVLPSRLFNRMVSWLTGVRLHDHNCGMKCYRRAVLDEVRLYGELHRFVPVLAAARGFRIGEIEIHHRPRQAGRSKYGMTRFVKGFLDLLTVKFLTGFGQRPQHALGTAGLAAFSLGGAGPGGAGLRMGRLAAGRRHGAGPSSRAAGVDLFAGPAAVGWAIDVDRLPGRTVCRLPQAGCPPVLDFRIRRRRRPVVAPGRAPRLIVMQTTTDSRAEFRRHVYLLLIVVSTGAMLGRILAVDAVNNIALESRLLRRIPDELQKKRAALESTGLSGKALDDKMARIEAQWRHAAHLRGPFLSANDRSRWDAARALVEGDVRVPGAPYAIDKVMEQPGWDTIDMVMHDGHYYSSKPPIISTIMAAVYWPIYRLTGATLETHPYAIGRFMLVLLNVIPLVICFLLLARLAERFGATDWGRLFVMATAAFGTFLTTFAVAINNHLLAAVCATAAVYAVVRIWFDGERRLRYFAVAGLFGGLAASFEFPAAALLAPLALLLFWTAPRRALVGFVPPVLIVAAALFGTNWIAHHSLKPAYLHRSGTDNWYDYTYQRHGHTVESHWKNPQGVDRGEPSRSIYALHVLVGHHGIFSLTPVWLLSLAGMVAWGWPGRDPRLRWMAATIAAITLACLVFYIGQPQMTRNYGGLTSGLRWMFWLAPLWLLTMLPIADAVAARRWTRGLALVLLAVSVLSASYPTWNPWTQPWLMNFMRNLGWIS